MAARNSARPGKAPHRLRPVIWGSLATVVTYACFQLLAAHSATDTVWWKNEWLRRDLHAHYPKLSFGAQAPPPGWSAWLPSAVTSVVLIGALALLALLLVLAGRGWGLFVVSLLPLVPAQIAPGVWAPELSNQVVYAVVWPVGATQPSTAWCWFSAGLEALVVALPALLLSAVVRDRWPAYFTDEVLRRMLPLALAAVAVVAWNSSAGEPQDWSVLARRAVWALVGALLLLGGLPRRWTVPLAVLLPAVAAGLLRWTTGVDGHPTLVSDASAWTASVAAFAGAAWVVGAPLLGWPVRLWRSQWRAMVAADTERRAAGQEAGAGSPDEPGSDVPAGPPVRRRALAAPAGAAGRHRA